jgi:hypothetical protein
MMLAFPPFSVVSQFTASGLNQFFVQDGKRIDPPAPTWEGLPASAEINEELCSNLFNVFNDYDRFAEIGGWSVLQDALSKPQVLVMSIWADVCNPQSILLSDEEEHPANTQFPALRQHALARRRLAPR